MKKPADFASKKEFFNYLVQNKSEIIAIKKSAIKFTLECGGFDVSKCDKETTKSLYSSYKDDVESGIIKRDIVGNTYNWMDSQDDVLLEGCAMKSINENLNGIWLLHDHEFKVTSKIGKINSASEKKVMWKDLGVNKFGYTTCLMAQCDIEQARNKSVFKDYLKGDINQHSIALTYVNMFLAVNDKDQKEEFAAYSKYIDMIGNKSEVDEQGYFFGVREIKWKELSCVLAGSNELTPTVENKEKETIIETKSESIIDKYIKSNPTGFNTKDFLNNFTLNK